VDVRSYLDLRDPPRHTWLLIPSQADNRSGSSDPHSQTLGHTASPSLKPPIQPEHCNDDDDKCDTEHQ
jgi:hypothetical protein